MAIGPLQIKKPLNKTNIQTKKKHKQQIPEFSGAFGKKKINKQNNQTKAMKKTLLLAAAALAAVSCSKRPIETIKEPGLEPNAVRFSSGATTVTPSKVTTNPDLGKEQGTIFEENDVIGVYAVLNGKKLSDGDAFPTNTALQYKKKKYKVESVDAGSEYLATFKPNSADETIYYLPGGQGYNYYAFYPTTEQNGKEVSTNYTFTESTAGWCNQTSLFTETPASSGTWVPTAGVAYPGPIMYAYYDTEDKALGNGQVNPAVHLSFKHAVAKLSLDVEMDETAGTVNDINAIELFANTGLYQGFTFDLTKASETPATVVTGNTSGTLLDGTGSGSSAKSYRFQNLTKTTSGPTTTSAVTGYLIPATGITNAQIRFTVGSGTNAQVFTAKLDKSSTGENVSGGENHLATIEAGKEYKFKITIKKTAVEFTGTIEDWGLVDNSSTEIPAE